ncbi:four-carbon acid sugar kinase family protein [Marivita sp.]|uniref:four-carbon acid sugar kinase family protein n=1 Tax=Marivita sp. TaxID=2003365 RepID=UPI003F6B8D62
MTLPNGILVAWVGDDFTGSAASMEVLEFAGVPAVLFLDVPTPEQLARFPDVRAIGIATTARSHSPDWMDQHLPPVFEFLKSTGAPVLHYKVCSTLDSAPHVGSIGKAINIGCSIVGDGPVPFLVAAPVMRRYQAFGHLFAGAGDDVYRLDRHPVMAKHPVTPMQEADVARHLSRQTDKPVGTATVEELDNHPHTALARKTGIVTLDAMTQSHMETNGALIWGLPKPCFVAGSQGIEYALVDHWRTTGQLEHINRTQSAQPVERIIAVSGSVSPTTGEQIAWAEANGFEVIKLDAAGVVTGALTDDVFNAAIKAIDAGRDPLICTARGPDDPAVENMRSTIKTEGIDPETANTRIGAALGQVLKRLLLETGLKRAVISGGDTSGHACRELGLYAFTALAPTIPGASLLTAHTEDTALAGLQLALKGGQMGSADYFGWIKRGGGAALEEVIA